MIRVEYEDFRQYYLNNNRLMYPLTNWSSKQLNDRQIASKYQEYCRKVDNLNRKNEEKILDRKIKYLESMTEDTVELSNYVKRVQEAMDTVHTNNDLSCFDNFYSTLSNEEKIIVNNNMWMCPKNRQGTYVYDGAHYISRSSKPNMAYVVENIVLLPRFVHSRIDNFLSIKGERLSKEQHHDMWERILGKERIDYLDGLYVES